MKQEIRFARHMDYHDYANNSKSNINKYLAIVGRASRLFVQADGFLMTAGPGLEKSACPFGRIEIAAWNKYISSN